MIRFLSRPALVTFALTASFCISGPQSLGAQIKKVAPSPAPGTLWLYPERIRLTDGTFAVAERGILFAPANRRNPGSDVIGVEVYRFRADRTANPATPPIFFLFGGPNFQGLEPSLSRPGYYEREIKPYWPSRTTSLSASEALDRRGPTLCVIGPDRFR